MLVSACSFSLLADKTIYVDPIDGSDLKNGTSWENAIRSLSLLPNMTSEGELTIVQLKENSEFEDVDNVDFGTKNINLVLEGNNATIKGKSSDKRMFRVAGPDSKMVLKNTVFRDKFTDGWYCGAVLIYVGEELTVEGCRFINNSCQTGGAALACRSVRVTIRNSYFQDNKATVTNLDTEGGAVKQSGRRDISSYLIIENSTFEGNTVYKGDGSAIGFYDRTGNNGSTVGDLCEVRIINCTFFDNKSLNPTAANVGAAVHFDYDMNNYGNKVPIDGLLVNNTFYGNAPAVSLEHKNSMFFINNVAVNWDDSSTAAAILKTDMNTAGQTTKGWNNVLISLKMPSPSREPDFVTGVKGNMVSQSFADIDDLGLDDFLTKPRSTDPFFVPYMAINAANSPLVNSGLDHGLVFFYGEEIIPATDVRKFCRNSIPDRGAYEWEGIENGDCIENNSIREIKNDNDLFILYRNPNEVLLINKINRSLNVKIVSLDGKIIANEAVTSVLTLNRKDFTPGVKIILVNDGKTTLSQKVLF
jgi:hypothetical protein